MVLVTGVSALLNMLALLYLLSSVLEGNRREGWDEVQNAGHDWVKKLLEKERIKRRRRIQKKNSPKEE